MSSYSDVQGAIVTALQAVPNIGTVHNRERYTANWQDFINMFQATISGTNQIRGWTVGWDGYKEPWLDAGSAMGVNAMQYELTVRGYLGLQDATDTSTTFDNLLEDVKVALQKQSNFGVSEVIKYSTEVIVGDDQVRFFGSVMCHFCEIKVRVTVRETVAWV